MTGKDINRLAAQLVAGTITADYISDKYGGDILTKVLGIAGGLGAGYVAGKVADIAYETPVVGDVLEAVAEPVADVVNSVLGIFK